MDKSSRGSSLDGCGQFVKYSIFVVNIILFLGGLAVVGLGIWVLVDGSRNDAVVINGDKSIVPAAILLAFGAAVSFISFLGCCGAVKEIRCLLMTFFIIELIISILFIVGVVLFYYYHGQIKTGFVNAMQESMRKYDRDDSTKNAWNSLQNNLKCCGTNTWEDWTKKNVSPPSSCICLDSDRDQCARDSTQFYWKQGCEEKIEEYIKKLATPLMAVAITIIVVLVLSMVFTCSLFLML